MRKGNASERHRAGCLLDLPDEAKPWAARVDTTATFALRSVRNEPQVVVAIGAIARSATVCSGLDAGEGGEIARVRKGTKRQ
jgi:hypothetical protein